MTDWTKIVHMGCLMMSNSCDLIFIEDILHELELKYPSILESHIFGGSWSENEYHELSAQFYYNIEDRIKMNLYSINNASDLHKDKNKEELKYCKIPQNNIKYCIYSNIDDNIVTILDSVYFHPLQIIIILVQLLKIPMQ